MDAHTITRPVLAGLQDDAAPAVSVLGWAYRVDFGPGVRPRLHTVNKQRRCQCSLGADCPAVAAVGDYLRAGGQRAPDPPFDFWPRLPEACPICGSGVEGEPGLTSREHGQGWRCNKNGLVCYWAARAVPLVMAQPARRYAIPPVGAASAEPVEEPVTPALPEAIAITRAWLAGLAAKKPEAAPRYPGITLADMATAREQAYACRAAWVAQGYFPET
jgi:hypothetical protein